MYHASPYEHGQTYEPARDIDAMVFDVSNRMARAQLARQISNSSSTFRQRASRILKPSSVGNSPGSLQRRRTVTSHTASQRRSELYHQGLQQAQQGIEQQNGHQSWSMSKVRPASNARPVSWHPSSMGLNRPAHRTSTHETSRQSMAAYQTMAVNGLPTPMTQPDLNNDLPVDPFFSLDNSNIPYQQPAMAQQAYTSAGLSLDTTYQSCFPLGHAALPQYTTVPASSDYSTYSPMNFATQSWAESLSAFPSYTAPPTPDYLPMQHPADIWQGVETTEKPALAKSQSKELVGMGLYDTPDRTSFSLDSLADSRTGRPGAYPHHESLGKGLKLEETWQPPEDEEDEEEEDEEEEEESRPSDNPSREDPPRVIAGPQIDLVGNKALEAPYAAYGDLSNQSFLFDNNDDCYDGGAFGQQVPSVTSNIPGLVLKDYYVWG
ncbi:hypothetical protein MMC30_004573 [Trapelia coarctata]|nr:hypothetical protein [Trapelia coarctata]